MKLKDEYNRAFVESLANKLEAKASFFARTDFVNQVLDDNWENRELKDRVRHISKALQEHIKAPYEEQVQLLMEVSPYFSGLPAFVFPDFVEQFGLNHFEKSMQALEMFTQQSTAEFAIRPFIEKDSDCTMQQLVSWSQHENHHLRRLASEGTRPRLPWASPLRAFIRNPEPSLVILENLKDDSSEYVRKSVANHLNDISKDHPALTLQIAKKWHGTSKNTDWIVKHGLRTLLKRGDKHALAIFGLNDSKGLTTSTIKLSGESVNIGDFIHFEFDVINSTNQQRAVRLEYKVDFMKANGKHSGKIFQISEFNLSPSSSKSFRRKQWFKQLTTRVHYPGKHKITLIINGDSKKSCWIDLIP